MFRLTGNPIAQDKWVLSSALQKLIRRGLTDHAVEVAHQLEVVSPGYVRRRLPVIAFEEVGLADGDACLEAVMRCRRADLQSGSDSATAEAVRALSNAVKSRTSCDAACLLEGDPQIQAAIARLAEAMDSDLLAIAANGAMPWGDRAAALGRLLNRRIRKRAAPPMVIDAVADLFGLPEAGSALLRLATTEPSMTAMLPLAFEAIRLSSGLVDEAGLPGSSELVNGVPLCALDMYCRTGRRVLARFVRESPEVQRLHREWRGPHSLLKAVSFAVFHCDSCALTRHVVAARATELREQIETLELAKHGVCGTERRDLYEAIKTDSGVLATLRTTALEALPCQ